MRVSPLILLVLVTACPQALADAEFVYESYEGVTIGRVFLSPAERDWLDARRHEQPVSARSGDNTGRSEPRKEPSSAAGYITGPDGRSRVYSGGDFVESAQPATHDMAFPGDVDIVRHAVKDAPDDED